MEAGGGLPPGTLCSEISPMLAELLFSRTAVTASQRLLGVLSLSTAPLSSVELGPVQKRLVT